MWIVGFISAVYFAGYHLFYIGLVEMFISLIESVKTSVSPILAYNFYFGLGKVILSSFTCWGLLSASTLLSTYINDTWRGKYD